MSDGFYIHTDCGKPLTARGGGSFCAHCNFAPDMQSIEFQHCAPEQKIRELKERAERAEAVVANYRHTVKSLLWQKGGSLIELDDDTLRKALIALVFGLKREDQEWRDWGQKHLGKNCPFGDSPPMVRAALGALLPTAAEGPGST